MIKKIITLLLFGVFCPVVAGQKILVLFDTAQYQIRCTTTACRSIKVLNKEKGTTKLLKDELEYEHFNPTKLEKDFTISFYETWTDELKMGRYLRIGYSITGYLQMGNEEEEEKHVLEQCAIIDLQTAQVKEVSNARGSVCNIDDYLSEVSFSLFEKTSAQIADKTYLYKHPNKKTEMYLIKGDKVTLLEEQIDNSDQKWYLISYKAKKNLTMWIKADTVDIK